MTTSRKAKKRVAVIGYGSQGRAIALNLRDSGYPVMIGLRAGSTSRKTAGRDGFAQIAALGRAAAQSDIIIMAIPDHEHGRVFARQIAPAMKRGATIVFLHGMSVHFGLVKSPKHCDIILIAPHSPGVMLREQFLGERAVSAFIAVAQNPTRKARTTARELAQAIGIARKRQISTTFAHEAIGDIFGEQAVLCGGLAMLIKHGFDVLVEAGLKADHAYLEVAYQLDLIIGLIKMYGVQGMFERISVTAKFGSLCAGPRILDQSVRERMQRELAGICTGRFAQKLATLTPRQISSLDSALAELTSPAFEKAARRLSSARRR